MKVKVIKMAKTNKRYEPEFKKKMVRLVLEEGRTIASVNKEYGLGEETVRSWIRQFEEKCEKIQKQKTQKTFMKKTADSVKNWKKQKKKFVS